MIKQLRSGLFLSSALASALLFLPGAAAPTSSPAPAAVVAPTAHPAVPTQILSHRAYYRMTLDSARNNSEVKGADGLMVFEWQDACDGWIVQQKLDVNFTHEEGNGLRLSSSYATWESKDGTRYNFNYKSTMNGDPRENFRGSASIPSPGRAGHAVFTAPEHREMELPEGTLFPTAHTMALITAAQAGKPMLAVNVFDGTDAEGMSEISAVIGAQQPVQVELAKQGLVGPAVVWPLRMAFFTPESNEAEPEYEMDTNMMPNGVSEFMVIDYGKFRLRGTLEKIELLPKPDC